MLSLLIIWASPYIVTGDGPCHLYNAKIINALLFKQSSSYYNTFFFFNSHISPNYTGHFLLAVFQLFFSASIAEKLFFTTFIFITVSGWYKLLQFSPNGNKHFVLFSFLLIFTHPLFKGFYNYSLSIACYAWVVYAWMAFSKKENFSSLLIALLISLFSLFSHPVGFLFSAFSAFLFISISTLQSDKEIFSRSNLWKFGAFTICIAPMLIYIFLFSTSTDGRELHFAFNHNWKNYIKMTSFMALSLSEKNILIYLGGFVNFIFLIALIIRIKKWNRIQLADTFLLTLLLAYFYYFFFPENFGCDLMELRVQIILYINLFLFISFTPFSQRIISIVSFIFLIGITGLFIIRGNVMYKAGKGVEEIIETAQIVKEKSTILFFSFDHNGQTEDGQLISDANWIFHHSAQYIGVDKDVLVLDNYEAHFPYFPLLWRAKYNPYSPLLSNGNFESETPTASLTTYMDSTSLPIDYIITWCYADSLMADSTIKSTMLQVDSLYELIKVSPTKRVRIYSLNK